MNCELCLKPYNQTDRQALSTPCCNESICKTCQEQIAGNPQNEFKCPFDHCKELTKNPIFKINRAIDKILSQSLGISCDNHPSKDAEYFCKDHNHLVCTACVFSTHKNHNYITIEKKSLNDYNNFILESLKTEYENIRQLIQ